MKWTKEQVTDLRILCVDETPNKDIAEYFGVPVKEIHAKRSQLGITIPKIKVAKAAPAITVNPEFEAAAAKAEPTPSQLPKSIADAFTALHSCVLLKMAHDYTSLEDAQVYCEMCDELIDLQGRYEKRLQKR